MCATSPIVVALVLLFAPPVGRPPVRVGLLGSPGDFSERWMAGAEEGVRRWNAAGGIRGRPLEVVRLPAVRPWSGGAGRIARLVVDHGLVALIGPGQGAAAHQAAQVATRLRVPLVTLCAEESLTRAGDRWVFRAVPSELQQARALVARALDDPRGARARLVVPGGREGRERSAVLLELCAELGLQPRVIVADGDGSTPDGGWGGEPGTWDVGFLWLDAAAALAFLERAGGWGGGDAPVLGSLRLDRPAFLARLSTSAPRLWLPHLGDAAGDPAFDLGRETLELIARAASGYGVDPAAIRRGLASVHGPSGASDEPFFDARGNRAAPFSVRLAGSRPNGQPPPQSPSRPPPRSGPH